jgi:ABC-type nitrate/sulfonate/bicarbonate transport system substrate-binding protein
MNTMLLRVFTIAAAAALASGWWLHGTATAPLALRLGTTRTPFSAEVWLAASRGYFSAEGLTVTVVPYASGKLALAEMLAGKVDFATAADTPIMFALVSDLPLRVLATLGTSSDATEVVARRDRGIASGHDLAGHRVGLVQGTTAQYFLDTFLEVAGLAAGAIERVALETDDLAPALADGRVDAIAAWTPYSVRAKALLGDRAVSLRAGSMYRWTWNLVASGVGDNPGAAGVLRALRRAAADLQADPDGVATEIAGLLGMPAESLPDELRHTRFEVTIDQALLVNLEMQARWAIGCGLARPGAVPNFLPAMAPGPLRGIDPALVTLIDGKERR